MSKNKVQKHILKCCFMTCKNTFEVYYADEKELLNLHNKHRRCEEHRNYESKFKGKKLKFKMKKV